MQFMHDASFTWRMVLLLAKQQVQISEETAINWIQAFIVECRFCILECTLEGSNFPRHT